MKKIILVLIALLAIASPALAVGTVTVTVTALTPDVDIVTYTWTADASAATVPSTASNVNSTGHNVYPKSKSGCVYMVVTDPGSTAPTANYDITLTDSNSVDIMGGELADRSATASEQATPKVGSVYACRPVEGAITLNISNNAVNSATGVVKVYIAYGD